MPDGLKRAGGLANAGMMIFIVSGFTQELVIIMVRETGGEKSGMSRSGSGKCSVCGMETKNDVCSGCGKPQAKCNCK